MVKEPITLRIEQTESGRYGIWLDDKKLHHIENYKVESLPFKGKAKLSIEMMVQYPTRKENECRQPAANFTSWGRGKAYSEDEPDTVAMQRKIADLEAEVQSQREFVQKIILVLKEIGATID